VGQRGLLHPKNDLPGPGHRVDFVIYLLNILLYYCCKILFISAGLNHSNCLMNTMQQSNQRIPNALDEKHSINKISIA
jgi:hypothetical protein